MTTRYPPRAIDQGTNRSPPCNRWPLGPLPPTKVRPALRFPVRDHLERACEPSCSIEICNEELPPPPFGLRASSTIYTHRACEKSKGPRVQQFRAGKFGGLLVPWNRAQVSRAQSANEESHVLDPRTNQFCCLSNFVYGHPE